MAVTWPNRRQDVQAGLDLLAAPPEVDENGRDQRWPDLTNAVHWVVDDTGWDLRPTADDVGTLLFDANEAEALAAVVSLVIDVSRRQGATTSDADWFADADWPKVQRAAKQAAALLRANDG